MPDPKFHEKKELFNRRDQVVSITNYEIRELIRALLLVGRCLKMRVRKHGCDVGDSRVFKKYFIKAIECFFRVYIASSSRGLGCLGKFS